MGAQMMEKETRRPASSVADALWRLYKLDRSAGQPAAKSSSPERAQLAQQVGGKLMTRYQYNRDIKREPVTQLRDSVCPECGTHYPPSHTMAKLTGSGEVRGCYICGRLVTFVMNPVNIVGNLAGGDGHGPGPTYIV